MHDLIHVLIETLLPRDLTCVLCDRELFEVNEGNFCNICMGSIQFIMGATCKSCGRQIPSSNRYGICNNCRVLDRHFDTGLAVLKYDDYSKQAFFDLKYFGKKYLAHTMAVYITKKLIEKDLSVDIDYFIPVPLHQAKLKKRGFNQAKLICKYLSQQTHIKTLDVLLRNKNTRPLNGLDPSERQALLEHAFSVKHDRDLKGKVIVLVDDIFTTGSTINACSKVLKAAGVAYIVSACFGIGD